MGRLLLQDHQVNHLYLQRRYLDLYQFFLDPRRHRIPG